MVNLNKKKIKTSKCTVGHKKIKNNKKRNTPITNNCTQMKLVPITMDYCPLQFDPLKFFRDPSTWGGVSLHNFNFFSVNSRAFQRNREVHLSNCLNANFHSISNISSRVVRHKKCS